MRLSREANSRRNRGSGASRGKVSWMRELCHGVSTSNALCWVLVITLITSICIIDIRNEYWSENSFGLLIRGVTFYLSSYRIFCLLFHHFQGWSEAFRSAANGLPSCPTSRGSRWTLMLASWNGPAITAPTRIIPLPSSASCAGHPNGRNTSRWTRLHDYMKYTFCPRRN